MHLSCIVTAVIEQPWVELSWVELRWVELVVVFSAFCFGALPSWLTIALGTCCFWTSIEICYSQGCDLNKTISLRFGWWVAMACPPTKKTKLQEPHVVRKKSDKDGSELACVWQINAKMHLCVHEAWKSMATTPYMKVALTVSPGIVAQGANQFPVKSASLANALKRNDEKARVSKCGGNGVWCNPCDSPTPGVPWTKSQIKLTQWECFPGDEASQMNNSLTHAMFVWAPRLKSQAAEMSATCLSRRTFGCNLFERWNLHQTHIENRSHNCPTLQCGLIGKVGPHISKHKICVFIRNPMVWHVSGWLGNVGARLQRITQHCHVCQAKFLSDLCFQGTARKSERYCIVVC